MRSGHKIKPGMQLGLEVPRLKTPHPNPLPQGERESEKTAASIRGRWHGHASWPCRGGAGLERHAHADAGHATQAAWFGRRNLAIEAGAGHKQKERNGP